MICTIAIALYCVGFLLAYALLSVLFICAYIRIESRKPWILGDGPMVLFVPMWFVCYLLRKLSGKINLYNSTILVMQYLSGHPGVIYKGKYVKLDGEVVEVYGTVDDGPSNRNDKRKLCSRIYLNSERRGQLWEMYIDEFKKCKLEHLSEDEKLIHQVK